jgi:hypothetical protein
MLVGSARKCSYIRVSVALASGLSYSKPAFLTLALVDVHACRARAISDL